APPPIPPDAKSYLFFFQAEDGIRDGHVTGVQTCALPIFRWTARGNSSSIATSSPFRLDWLWTGRRFSESFINPRPASCTMRRERSEERRVGKEWKSWRRSAQGEKTRRPMTRGKRSRGTIS